ncbi:MAG: DUF4954 family protein, partial [Sediminibacterium sp.]|nr:DUF4954 family protein [Sediminibacterium sp.]
SGKAPLPEIIGKQALQAKDERITALTICLEGIENSKRKTVLLKVQSAYDAFHQMLLWYGLQALLRLIREKNCNNISQLRKSIPPTLRLDSWVNMGGQLIKQSALDSLISKIKSGKIKSWNAIHDFYEQQGNTYADEKQLHALAVLEKMTGISLPSITGTQLNQLLEQALQIQQSISANIRQSRMKDYDNAFRKMVYSGAAEMKAVIGDPEQNSFLQQQKKDIARLKKTVQQIRTAFVLQTPQK